MVGTSMVGTSNQAGPEMNWQQMNETKQAGGIWSLIMERLYLFEQNEMN